MYFNWEPEKHYRIIFEVRDREYWNPIKNWIHRYKLYILCIESTIKSIIGWERLLDMYSNLASIFFLFIHSLHNENVVLSKSNRHKKHTKDNSHFRSLFFFFSSFFVVNIINVIKFYSLWGTEESRKSSFKNESSMRLKKWKLQTANNHKNRMEVKHKLN